jgi:integration host factor subunit beta
MEERTMTKADLVEKIAVQVELSKKDSEIVVNTVFRSIIDALTDGDKVELRGFGSFRTRARRSRTGRNPKTGDKVAVPEKKVPFFKPGKNLKKLVNE